MNDFVKILWDFCLGTFWGKNKNNLLWAIAIPHKKWITLASKYGVQLNNESLQQDSKTTHYAHINQQMMPLCTVYSELFSSRKVEVLW